MQPPLTVRVPASTSNLGTGFDLLGLALDLYLEITALPGDSSGDRFEHLDGPPAHWPSHADNHFLRALRDAAPEWRDCRFAVRSDIPIGRGLGSSAAALVAGSLLGHALAGRAPSRTDMFRTLLPVEGHPDNLAPALWGGCRLSIPEGPVRPCTVHESLQFTLAWPSEPMPTAQARAALPTSVPHGDAVRNSGGLIALLDGLRDGDPDLLRLGGRDRLHVPFRLPLIPGAAEALERAYAAGAHLATLSGSGSALIGIASTDRIDEVGAALASGLAAAGAQPTLRRAQIEHRGGHLTTQDRAQPSS